jgi:hypothetical protein
LLGRDGYGDGVHDGAVRRSLVGSVASVAVTLLVTTCFVGDPAFAHNGVGAAFKGRAGPYAVYAYDGYPVSGGVLAYRLVVVEAGGKEPALDVAVQVSAAPLRQPSRSARSTVHAPAQVYANVVFYDLPNPYPGDWKVAVELSGTAGRGRVSFAMHGTAPVATASASPAYAIGGGSSSWPLVGTGVGASVVVVGAAVAGWALRRRRKTRRGGGAVAR